MTTGVRAREGLAGQANFSLIPVLLLTRDDTSMKHLLVIFLNLLKTSTEL